MSVDLQFNNAESLITRGWLPSVETNIQETQYCYGTIESEKAFLQNLRFMGAPHDWYAYGSEKPITEEGRIYSSITGTGGHNTVSLHNVVSGIIRKYGNGKADDSSQILYRLGMANKWYKRFLAIGAYFDWRLFTPLWVRNWGDRQSLYIEDGNTRSLAYAMRVVCNEEDYKPAPIIWCRSWSHVLSWADNYERDPNADEKYGSHANIDGIKWN